MEIKIEMLKLSFGEIDHARRLYKKSQPQNWKQFFTVAGILLLFVGSPIILIGIFLPGERTEIVRILWGLFLFFSQIALAGVLIGLIIVLIRWAIFQIRNSKFPGYSVIFTLEGIEVSQNHIMTKNDWTLFHNAMEDKKCFLLIKDKRSYMLVPKRVLAIEQQDALRGLIKERFPDSRTIS